MFEPKASSSFLPNDGRHIWEPANGGQRLCGRVLLVTFLGETRKVTGCRATPDQHPRSNNRFSYRPTEAIFL